MTEPGDAREAAASPGEPGMPDLVDRVPGVLWSTDAELRFTLSRGAGLAALGLRPDEAVGLSLFEFFGTDDPELEPIAAHRRALAGEPVRYEFAWGEHVWESHVQALRGPGGEIVGTGCLIEVLREAPFETISIFSARGTCVVRCRRTARISKRPPSRS